MIITLNRDEILKLVTAQLGNRYFGLVDPQDHEVNIDVGFINGDLAVVVGVSEEIPEGTFDGEDFQPEASTDVETAEDVDNTVKADKPKQKRKRRTRQEIEADEAAARAAEQSGETAEPLDPVEPTEPETPDEIVPKAKAQEETPVLETQPEEAADQAPPFEPDAKAAEPENLFSVESAEPPRSLKETNVEPGADDAALFADPASPEANVVSGDPLTDSNAGNIFGSNAEENLFAEPAADVKPVTESQDGFAKPSQDDDVLNMFQ